LPKQLADLAFSLDRLRLGDEVERVVTFTLFHRVLFYRLSDVLYRNVNPTMGELSRALSVPLSTATRMVGWLVDMGYGERLPDQHDRRVVRISLTDSGRVLYEAVESFVTRRLEQIVVHLTTEERSALLVALSRMMAVLENAEQ